MLEHRYISINLRVHWQTPEELVNDADTDLVWETVKYRVEECLRANICGQVGAVPGTEKMELLYATVI